jgi:hypothetical protein
VKQRVNIFCLIVAVLQAGAAIEALYRHNYKMAVVFIGYGICSGILSTVRG